MVGGVRQVDQYAVFGSPVSHSMSPEIHQMFARQFGECIRYDKIEVSPEAFEGRVKDFFARGGCGLNITVPHKLDALRLADELSPRAARAGAVNTLYLCDDRLMADNTDGVGLVTDLTQVQGWELEGKRVLLLGAGGAVRGVLGPLLEKNPASITIANRTLAKAQALKTLFQDRDNLCAVAYPELSGHHFDIVINGTSASLAGDLPPLPEDLLSPEAACYDMMYGKEPTVFLQWAEKHGATNTADGLGMLVGQAAESFYLWRNKRPEVAPVIEALRAS